MVVKQGVTHQQVTEVLRMTFRNGIDAIRNRLWSPELMDGKPAKSGIMEAIALEGLLFGELGAMVGWIYVNHILLEGSLLKIHLSAVAVPLIGMTIMYFLRSSVDNKTPAHDRSTIMFLRWTIPACLLMVFLITWNGMAGTLSGKLLPLRLPVVYTKITEWPKETDKRVAKHDKIVEAYAALPPPRDARLPGDTLVIVTTLLPNGIEGSWEILGTASFVGGVESKDKTSFSIEDEKSRQHRLIVDNYDFTKLYTIKVVLHQKNSKIAPEDVVKLIEANGVVEKGVLTITAHYWQRENQ